MNRPELSNTKGLAVPGMAWPEALCHCFRLIVLDWDGTAVENRREDATPTRSRFERLLRLGVRLVVVTGTHFENIDDQLCAAIEGPFKERLFVCTNRGSEAYGFTTDSIPLLLYRRVASVQEDEQLTAIADAVVNELRTRTGLDIQVVYNRLNRRKIDLIPLPEWKDPPKSEIGALRTAVDQRLVQAGLAGGIAEAVALTHTTCERLGMPDARITSDAKNVEIGLTDKSDAMDWIMRNVAEPAGAPVCDVLIAGDEFGPVGGDIGSDARQLIPSVQGAAVVSVGPEPFGAPPGVVLLGGGPLRFRDLLDDQIARWELSSGT